LPAPSLVTVDGCLLLLVVVATVFAALVVVEAVVVAEEEKVTLIQWGPQVQHAHRLQSEL
jgi:hypothetical protein